MNSVFINLTLKSGSKATFFFDGNLVVTSDAGKNVKIHNATHNNGGWQLSEDYTHDDVVRMIELSLEDNPR